MAVEIASGSLEDLEAISEIYAHYVRTSAISFDVEVPSAVWRREWFTVFDTRGRHRLLVIRSQGRAVGYAASVPYRPRAAYAPSVETSVYVAQSHVGQGLGSALYGALLAELEREDVHRAYAGIAIPNAASVRLHERRVPPRRLLHGARAQVRAILGCRLVRTGLPGGGVHDLRVRGWTRGRRTRTADRRPVRAPSSASRPNGMR